MSADKRRDDVLDSEVNVIPYLQDYLPFATKRPPAAVAAVPLPAKSSAIAPGRIVLGSGASAPPAAVQQSSNPSAIKAVGTSSPVGPPSRHETVIGGASGGSEFTVGAVMHTLSNHRQSAGEVEDVSAGPMPIGSSASGPPPLDDQGFQVSSEH